MLTWMQKHKKWLVITIWISTIAFVGAGFVGWGSYDYSNKAGVVAVVGDREVSVEELQEEYSNLYNQYANMFGSMFNDKMAEQFNLKDTAYNQVLQKNLILSYADELGLDVTDEEIAKELLLYKAFQKNGKFDKETYVKVLTQNRMKPVTFEESLKRNLLLQKVQTLFELTPSKSEIENLSKLIFLEDDITYKVLSISDIQINPSEADLKSYWEKNKKSYMSKPSFELLVKEVSLVSSNATDNEIKEYYDKFKMDYKKADGKLKTLDEAKVDVIKSLDEKFTKTEALKTYLKIKKDEEKIENKVSYTEDAIPFSQENKTKILSSKIGEVIKPFFEKGKYYIVKIANKIDSKELAFSDALENVKTDYIRTEKAEKLKLLAKEQLKSFDGTKVTNIARTSVDKIVGLTPKEADSFLGELFSTTTKEGSINLEEKIVLFRIDNSQFAKYDSKNDEIVKSTLSQLQNQELMSNLLKKLENSYQIQSSVQTKDK